MSNFRAFFEGLLQLFQLRASLESPLVRFPAWCELQVPDFVPKPRLAREILRVQGPVFGEASPHQVGGNSRALSQTVSPCAL
jgi:hypothetical protein